MPIIKQLLELFGVFSGLIYENTNSSIFRLIVFTIAIATSLAGFYYWYVLEKKYEWSRWLWGNLFRFFSQARIDFNDFKKDWINLKKPFLVNPLKSVIDAEKFFDQVFDLYGYLGKSLTEQIGQASLLTLPRRERLQKTVAIVEAIKLRIKTGGKIDLSKKEILTILEEFENNLFDLLVIGETERWVKNQIAEFNHYRDHNNATKPTNNQASNFKS
ncbi:MAG: hypothetical protein M1505_02565 [Patescibacteria group bacterium]|nr:hypothetical protein [Patescibacteria group bacterium]